MNKINESELDWTAYDRDDTDSETEFRRKELATAVDGDQLGCSLYVGSPPGGRDERPFEGYSAIDDDTDYWEE